MNIKLMKNQALQINTWGNNVYVKIPVVNSKGVFMGKIIKELNNQNIKLNITAVYNAKQTRKILKSINKKSKSYNFNICRKSWRYRQRPSSRI